MDKGEVMKKKVSDKKKEKLLTLHSKNSLTKAVQQTVKEQTLQNLESEGWKNKKFICNVSFPDGQMAPNCSLTIPEIDSCRANGISVLVHPDQ